MDVKELLKGATGGEWEDVGSCVESTSGDIIAIVKFSLDAGSEDISLNESNYNAKLIAATPTIARDYLKLQDNIRKLAEKWKELPLDTGYYDDWEKGARAESHDCADELMELINMVG